MASNALNEAGKTSQYRDFFQELECEYGAAATELASFSGVGRQPVYWLTIGCAQRLTLV